jgi:hypothetical protein
MYEGVSIGTEYADDPEELDACIFRVKVFKEDLEDGAKNLHQNIHNCVPFDTVSYPKRVESSNT